MTREGTLSKRKSSRVRSGSGDVSNSMVRPGVSVNSNTGDQYGNRDWDTDECEKNGQRLCRYGFCS